MCTIEKANTLVNAAAERNALDGLGVAVLDELHMVDDPHRGYLLELLATKLLCLDGGGGSGHGNGVQIIGMSATLADTEQLARRLDAKFYCSAYKPVPIEEYLVHENQIYQAPAPPTLSAKKRDLEADQ